MGKWSRDLFGVNGSFCSKFVLFGHHGGGNDAVNSA